MKAIDEHLYERGESRIKYVRCRIPADIRSAYPSAQTHIAQSLGTSDLSEAKSRVRIELVRMEEAFEQVRLVLKYGNRDVGFKYIRRHGGYALDRIKDRVVRFCRFFYLPKKKQRCTEKCLLPTTWRNLKWPSYTAMVVLYRRECGIHYVRHHECDCRAAPRHCNSHAPCPLLAH